MSKQSSLEAFFRKRSTPLDVASVPSKRTDFRQDEDDLDSTSEKSQEDVLDRMDDFMDNDEPSLSEDEQDNMTPSEHFQMTDKAKYVHRRDKRSHAVYRKEWETKYDYLAESQKGRAYFNCIVCVEDLHLSTMGETAVKSHSKSKKHQQAMSQKNKTIPLAQFTKRTVNGMSNRALASEATWAYHIVRHHQSFSSANCTNQIFPLLFNWSESAERFASAWTKTTKIVQNVLAPFFHHQFLSRLRGRPYSVSTDASNHSTVKMFPIVIRFFGEDGIENRLLDIQSNATETAEDVANLIKKSLFGYKLDPQLFTSFCADNTSTNFGGVKRRGLNNVYRHLKNDVNAEIVGVGCGSHVLHNASQKGTDKLQVNVPRLAMEIRSHFSSQSKRWAKLGEFCEFVGEIKHEPLPSHADTRWLTLLPLVTRILKLWPALESYFRSTDDCSNDLTKMFCEEKSAYYECYFLFLDYALPMFNVANQKLQANNYTFVESVADIRKLILQLTAKSESTFFGLQVQKLLKKIEMEQGKQIQDRILASFQAFFKRTADYIQEWTSSLEEYGDRLDWIMLEDSTAVESIDEESLTLSIATISSVLAEDHFIGSDLLEMKEMISSLRPNKDFWELPIDKKWRILLRNKNFRVLNSFIPKVLCVPASNAFCERIFSLINAQWTDDRNRLAFETVSTIASLRTNSDENCAEAYDLFLKSPQLLQALKSDSKYRA